MSRFINNWYSVTLIEKEVVDINGVHNFYINKCIDEEVAVYDAVDTISQNDKNSIMLFKILELIYKDAYTKGTFNDAYYLLKDIMEIRPYTSSWNGKIEDLISDNIEKIKIILMNEISKKYIKIKRIC